MKDQSVEKTILLVEDEAIIALSEKRILTKNGFSVLQAYNGEDAVACISDSEGAAVDLVLMDIDLGDGIDGTEAARRILEIRKLPVVFLTSHSEKEMVEKVRSITRYGYVLKNSGEFVLISSIEMAFELFNAHLTSEENRKHYYDLFNSSIDGIAETDMNGNFTRVNRAFLNLLGYRSIEELRALSYEDITPEEFLEMEENIIREQTLVRGYSDEYEKEYIHSSGRRVWVSIRGWLRRDEWGSLKGMWVIVRDITRRKEEQERLRISEEKFRDIFNASPLGIELYDMEGKLVDANKACLTIFGTEDINDIIGFNLFDDPNVTDEQKAKLRRGEIVSYTAPFDFHKVKDQKLYKTKRSGIIHIRVTITPFGGNEKKLFSGFLVQVEEIDDSGGGNAWF